MYQWPSPGKLNLFLYITGRYANGYHHLQTLFQLIDYGDTIEFFITFNNKIRLINTIEEIENHNNLIIKAAQLLHNYCKLYKKKLGVDIFLHKFLPIGSGLGGGSSNAATTLIVLNKKWKCYLKKSVLMHLGLMLGADVPVFIHGFSSFGTGIGNKLVPINLPKKWYLIIMPSIKISTRKIFNIFYLFHKYSPKYSMHQLLQIPFYNALEPIVKKMFPEIIIYFDYLSQYTTVRLTGTGACMFAEFRTEHLAYKVQGYLPSWIKSVVVPGVFISPLHQAVLQRTT